MSPDNAFISRILVTTAGSEVYEIAAKSGNITLLHEAHFEGRNPLRLRAATVLKLLYLFCMYFVSIFPPAGELWGLATHPTDPDVFATCGDDKTIRIWSILARRLLRKAIIGNARLTWSQTFIENRF